MKLNTGDCQVSQRQYKCPLSASWVSAKCGPPTWELKSVKLFTSWNKFCVKRIFTFKFLVRKKCECYSLPTDASLGTYAEYDHDINKKHIHARLHYMYVVIGNLPWCGCKASLELSQEEYKQTFIPQMQALILCRTRHVL